MRLSDVDAVARLRYEAFFNDAERTLKEDAQGLAHLVSNGFERALIAEIESGLAGSVLLVREELQPVHDVAPWLAGLVVKPEHRGQGIGSRLVGAIEAYARSIGCRSLHLYTYEVEAFYRRLGWVAADRFDYHGEPMVLMTRDLK